MLYVIQATKASELHSKQDEGIQKFTELPLVTKLKTLNSSLTTIEVPTAQIQ